MTRPREQPPRGWLFIVKSHFVHYTGAEAILKLSRGKSLPYQPGLQGRCLLFPLRICLVPWRELWGLVDRSSSPTVAVAQDLDNPQARSCAWGDPSERDHDLLEQNVAEGLISPERAREVYGYDA